MTHWKESDIDWLDDNVFSETGSASPRIVLNELEESSSKRSAYRTIKIVQEASRLEELQGKLNMLREHDGELSLVSKRRLMYQVSAAASILLLAAVVGWLLFGQTGNALSGGDNLYVENLSEKFIMHDTDRSPDILSDQDKQSFRAYNLFDLQKFPEAINYLKPLWEDDGDELALYYLILSYYFIGQEDTAKELYEENYSSLKQEYIDILKEDIFN